MNIEGKEAKTIDDLINRIECEKDNLVNGNEHFSWAEIVELDEYLELLKKIKEQYPRKNL